MILRMIFALLLIPSLLYAGQGMGPGPGFKTYGTADYCAGKLGSYSLYYDADHPNGTTTACIIGSTTTVGMTGTDPTISTSCNLTSGGTYGVCWAGGVDKYLAIPNPGLTYANGRIELAVKLPATMPTADMSILEWYDSTVGVRAILNYNATGAGGQPGFQLVFYHIDGTTISSSTAYTASTDLAGTTKTIIVDWLSGGNLISSFSGSTVPISLGTATPFTVTYASYVLTTDEVRFGEKYNTGSCVLSFDDIKIGASQQ